MLPGRSMPDEGNSMTFHQEIAAIQAAMTGRGATGEAGNACAQPVSGLREGRQIFDNLAAQFDTHIGSSVICLPMGDGQRAAVPDVRMP